MTPNAPAVTTDQRGYVPRPTLNCSVGAFEYGAAQATNTLTSTNTATASNTATNTPSNTSTATASNTATNTPSSTSTATASNTATNTPSSTPSSTSTATASNTATNTPSSTNTVTASVTNTVTPSLTNTASVTATLTPTATNTQPPGRIDSIGIYRPGNGAFYLRLHNSSGASDLSAVFNPAPTADTVYPIVGDWAGTTFDSIGVYDRTVGRFFLRNTITAGTADETILFGNPNDYPLSGRWVTTATHAGIGVQRTSNGIVYLANSVTTPVTADYSLVFGNPGDQAIAGDWTGIGQDGLGVYRPGNQNFYLVNRAGNGIIYSVQNFPFGGVSDVAIAGDWIGQGHDGVGVFRPSNATVYLKNALTTGAADNSFLYGASTDLPIAGHWQVTYPPIAPPPALHPTLQPGSISVPGGNQIGG